MPQLTDLQQMLLTTAATRTDGGLLPASDTVDVPAYRIHKAAERLIALGFADEQEVADEGAAWRAADGVWIGAVITDAGRAQFATSEPTIMAEPEPQPAPKRQTKTEMVVALLARPGGASVDEIVKTTDWQPHTTRAMLTGLRKKGHAVVKSGERGALRYRIEAAAQ